MQLLAVMRPANLVNSNEVRAVRRGGNVTNGSNAGPCYFNANNNPSNANWNYGSALKPYPAPARALMRPPVRRVTLKKIEDLGTSFSVVGHNRNAPAGAA